MTSLRGGNVLHAGIILGIALSGFADGILLHQVLQWHHFLSLVPGETFRDLRVQIFADGLFHIFVYAVTAAGLWALWRSRALLDAGGGGRRLLGGLLLGYGGWNMIDVGVFHWLLGIHRVRVNVANPLAYDLAWLLLFGVAVAALGMVVLRRPPGAGGGRRTAAAVVAAIVAAVPVAGLPPRNGDTLVLFRPRTRVADVVNAIVPLDGRILLLDPQGAFALVRLPQGAATGSLYRNGALLVTRSPLIAGCLAFAEA